MARFNTPPETVEYEGIDLSELSPAEIHSLIEVAEKYNMSYIPAYSTDQLKTIAAEGL